MATKPLPSQEVLRQLLDYDPETGALTWRERGGEWFRAAKHAKRWNGIYAGRQAFTCTEPRGYKTGAICGTAFKAHRVIWKWMTGGDPEVIDHINGNRADNRWSNLADTNNEGNTRNAKLRSDNKSGVAGVKSHKRAAGHPGWVVTAGSDYLGLFDCFGKAVKVRKEAERRRGFHENHGRTA